MNNNFNNLLIIFVIYIAYNAYFEATAATTQISNQNYQGISQYISLSGPADQYIITNCTFTNCINSTGDGGAIRTYITNLAQMSIINSSFTKCQCKHNGGAINADIRNGGKLTLDGLCVFTQCYADYTAGGIYVQFDNGAKSFLILEDGLKFISCSANTVNGAGGAMFITYYDAADISMNNILFENCYSYDGGALYINIWATTPKVLDINCTFINCSSYYGGGLNIAGVEPGYQFQLTGSITYINCLTQRSGGGMYIDIRNPGNVEYNDIVFNSCTASNGGGLYMSSYFNCKVVLNRFRFQDCYALLAGGLNLYVGECTQKAEIELVNTTIINCSSNNHVGGMCGQLYTNASLSIKGSCLIQDCVAVEDGGGIYLLFSNGSFEAENLLVKNCTAKHGGGMHVSLYDDGGTGILQSKCEFYQCRSNLGSGGALRFEINFTKNIQFEIRDAYILYFFCFLNCQLLLYLEFQYNLKNLIGQSSLTNYLVQLY